MQPAQNTHRLEIHPALYARTNQSKVIDSGAFICQPIKIRLDNADKTQNTKQVPLYYNCDTASQLKQYINTYDKCAFKLKLDTTHP